jgi:4-diphosphocytidyl-2-C-methyl-D-erythritol kinase
MIVFPNCKINLGLRILRKRQDGYHDLETIFFPIPVTDILEIRLQRHENGEFKFIQTGFPITGPLEENSCIKAYQLLKNRFPLLKSVDVHLHKNIPTGAGLGGGSADSAFMLQGLNELFQLSLSHHDLAALSLQLGSDCPFFLLNKPAIAEGRGEILKERKLSLRGYHLLLINPGVHISTAVAFRGCKPDQTGRSVASIIQQPITTWKEDLKNQFEDSIFEQFPDLASIKETLYTEGAIYASMSGSGSTLFGIFPETTPQPNKLMQTYPWSRWMKLS